MSRVLRLRKVSEEESEQIHKLATSRTQPARLVQRARIIQLLLDNPKLPTGEAGKQVGYKSDYPGRTWVKRFNERGIQGLEDEPRSGHPPFYDEETRSSLIDLVLQKPRSLGYPFELWTQERLQQAFEERHDIHHNTQESRCEDSFASLARDPDTVHSQVCMLAQPDRAMVEAVTLPGVKRATFREC